MCLVYIIWPGHRKRHSPLFNHFILKLICFSFILGTSTGNTESNARTESSKTTLLYLWYWKTLTSIRLTNSVVSFLWIHGKILITFKQLMFSLYLVANFLMILSPWINTTSNVLHIHKAMFRYNYFYNKSLHKFLTISSNSRQSISNDITFAFNMFNNQIAFL